MSAQGERGYPTGVVATCAILALALFGYAGYALWTNDPRHSLGMAGLLLGPFLLFVAFKAHRRAKHAAGLADAEVAPEPAAAAHAPVAMRATESYTLLGAPQPISRLGAWWRNTGPYTQVVGFTCLGTAFLRNPADGTYVALWPLRAGRNASSLGAFDSLEDFEARFLRDPEAAKAVLDAEKVATIRQSFGRLKPGQVYIPVPMLLALGGKTPKGYDKGDFWVFMDLCGQTHESLGG